MAQYRRLIIPGATYFFTQITYQRFPWLCKEIGRKALREAIEYTREIRPFKIDAIVLLPDHLHCIYTLPEGDSNYSTRWRSIKQYVTRNYAGDLNIQAEINLSRKKRKEKNIWQRRYWEHCITDEKDYENHCNYIHYNPVKHGLCQKPSDWQYSSFHRFVKEGMYSQDWGINEVPTIPLNIIE
jgi:putative transposase